MSILTADEFEKAAAKADECRNVDFSRWNGKIVGRHLFKAGESRMMGMEYEFPGYVRFPYKLFDHMNEEHLPFNLEEWSAHNLLLTMEYGEYAYREMIKHHCDYRSDLINLMHDQMAQLQEEEKRAEAGEGQSSSEGRQSRDGQVTVLSNLSMNLTNFLPQQQPDQNIEQPTASSSLPTTSNVILDAPAITQRSKSGLAQALNGSNALASSAIPENTIEHASATDAIVPEVGSADLIDAIETVPAIPDIVDNVMVDMIVENQVDLQENGFGPEDQHQLRREAEVEFGFRAIRNADQVRQLGEILNQDEAQEAAVVQPIRRRAQNRRDENIRRNQHQDRNRNVNNNNQVEGVNAALYEEIDEMKNIVELQNGENRDGVIAMVAENLPEILPQVQIEQDDGLNLQSILEVLNDPAPQVVATDQINQEPMEIEMPAALPSTSIAQHTGLDEHGLPQQGNLPAEKRSSQAIDNALSRMRHRSRSRQRKHQPRPREGDQRAPNPALIKRLEEFNYEWHPSFGDLPDFTMFYDRIFQMIVDYQQVPIQRYTKKYEDEATRFKALVALCNIASDGVISIERIGENGPILSFQREE